MENMTYTSFRLEEEAKGSLKFVFLNAGQRVSASAHAWAPGLIKRRQCNASV